MQYNAIPAGVASENARPVVFDVRTLWRRLEALSNRRHERGKRYALALVLLIVVLAKLSGEDRPSGIADWVKHRRDQLARALGLDWGRPPHHNTYRRILAHALSPGELDRAIGAFFRDLPQVGASLLISMDGKTIRGTIDSEDPHGEHLLVAYLPQEGIVLLQLPAGHKENEISVAPRLLRGIDPRGKIVAADAMHTQRELSAQILETGVSTCSWSRTTNRRCEPRSSCSLPKSARWREGRWRTTSRRRGVWTRGMAGLRFGRSPLAPN